MARKKYIPKETLPKEFIRLLRSEIFLNETGMKYLSNYRKSYPITKEQEREIKRNSPSSLK